jgi:hypothetical protein
MTLDELLTPVSIAVGVLWSVAALGSLLVALTSQPRDEASRSAASLALGRSIAQAGMSLGYWFIILLVVPRYVTGDSRTVVRLAVASIAMISFLRQLTHLHTIWTGTDRKAGLGCYLGFAATLVGIAIYPLFLDRYITGTYAGLVPRPMRYIAWYEMLFLCFQLARIATTWARAATAASIASGLPAMSLRPFLRYTIGVVLGIAVMLTFACDFWASTPYDRSLGMLWVLFVLLSIGGLTSCSRALDHMQIVDKLLTQA